MQSKTANKATNYRKEMCKQMCKNCLNLHATNSIWKLCIRISIESTFNYNKVDYKFKIPENIKSTYPAINGRYNFSYT